ncbi:MAG TPA: methyltransferase domain-containing protein [Desulfobacterales bacterium]|nr:methyltransferase domain-containing protein [Desulfobacterales bacterium]
MQETYDFVTFTETVEHFAAPRAEFLRLDALLRPGSRLEVMTLMLEDDAAFPTWWYTRDRTHVCFYRADTMRWIAGWLGWRFEFPEPGIVLFEKAGRAGA